MQELKNSKSSQTSIFQGCSKNTHHRSQGCGETKPQPWQKRLSYTLKCLKKIRLRWILDFLTVWVVAMTVLLVCDYKISTDLLIAIIVGIIISVRLR